jgi:putative membrane protein
MIYMLILILLLIVGSVLVYISRYNFMPVTLNLGMYVLADIPLFYVIIGSVLVGLLVAYILYLIDAIIASFELKGKDKEIRKTRTEVLELTKRVHQLELENERLKHTSKIEPEDPDAL